MTGERCVLKQAKQTLDTIQKCVTYSKEMTESTPRHEL